MVVKNVLVANVHVDKYANVNHAVVVHRKDLYRADNYRNNRIQRPDRSRIAHEYQAVPVIDAKASASPKGTESRAQKSASRPQVRKTDVQSAPDYRNRHETRVPASTTPSPILRAPMDKAISTQPPSNHRLAPVSQKKSDSDGNNKDGKYNSQRSDGSGPIPARERTRSEEPRPRRWESERRENHVPNQIKKDNGRNQEKEELKKSDKGQRRTHPNA